MTPNTSTIRSLWIAAVITGAVLGLTGCISFGGGEPAPTGGDEEWYRKDVRGVVDEVDVRARRVTVRTDGGELSTYRYSAETVVYHEGIENDPRTLDAGEEVVLHLRRDDEGDPYVDWIELIDGDVRPVDDEPEIVGNRVSGEVERVLPSSRELVVDTDEGRVRLGYGPDTPVYYEGREYRVDNLEPGDLITAEVTRAQYGDLIVSSIDVDTSVQDRRARPDEGDITGDRVRLAGTVSWVDPRDGAFGLATRGGDQVRVVLPFNATQDVRQTFDRLRRGQRVEVVGVELEQGVVELDRFF